MNTSILKIIVNGASGRVGARLCALSSSDPSFELVAALARPGSPSIGRNAIPSGSGGDALQIAEESGAQAHVVIDFSSDEGARRALALSLDRGAALLVGTTALSSTTTDMLREGAKKIPVLIAPNTSLGVAAVADAASRLARALGPEFRCSIVEAHHMHKKDAPSGTAIRLAKAVKEGGGELPEDQVLSIRAGDIIGEHTIRFAGPGEYVELTHRATTRDVFALGALRAARWLAGRSAGWWTMEDVLGFTRSPR